MDILIKGDVPQGTMLVIFKYCVTLFKEVKYTIDQKS